MSVESSNIFLLRQYLIFLNIANIVFWFLSISGAVSVKTGGKQLPVMYELMLVTILYSI